MTTGSGLSVPRLRRLHRVLTAHVERGELTGLAWLVARRGQVQADAVGTVTADGAPVGPDTIFRISSLTKPVIGAAAMILAEECALRLDDPVEVLVPELSGRRVLRRPEAPLHDTVAVDRPPTIRDLLTFTFGIGMVFAPPGAMPIAEALADPALGQGAPAPAATLAPDAWLARLGDLPLVYQPGHAWLYSTSADILGILVARAAGQPLDVFLRERLFGPLGMRDTGFSVPADQIARLATSRAVDPETGGPAVYDEAAGGQWSSPPAFPSAAGGLVSTLSDYFAFADMLRARGRFPASASTPGGGRILARPSVELMTSDQLSPEQKAAGPDTDAFRDVGWGFCMSVVTRRSGFRSVGTYGFDGGLGTSWYNDPAEDLTMILMTQQMWPALVEPPAFADFWTLAYQSLDD